VVELEAAATIEDTRCVHLEVRVDGNGYRDGSDVKGGLKSSNILGLDVYETRGGRGRVNGARGAALASGGRVARSVGVIGLRAETTVALDPVKGLVHPATVAASIDIVAINELLLGELLKRASLLLVSTLDGTSGGESPT
jgi:hypothetical protein